jgi:hypothetical protein
MVQSETSTLHSWLRESGRIRIDAADRSLTKCPENRDKLTTSEFLSDVVSNENLFFQEMSRCELETELVSLGEKRLLIKTDGLQRLG